MGSSEHLPNESTKINRLHGRGPKVDHKVMYLSFHYINMAHDGSINNLSNH